MRQSSSPLPFSVAASGPDTFEKRQRTGAVQNLAAVHTVPEQVARYLADEFEIVYTASLSLLNRCAARERRDKDHLLLVQNPTGDLRFSEVEGRLLQRLFSSCTPFDRTTASKARILESGERAHVKHYTGHSYFHPNDPLQSALILESSNLARAEAWLTLRDAFTRLNLHRNRLTILNGCESGVLLPDPVDEYVNLPTGFLFAGAACVISTLWPVWDISSALLMVRFHQEWKADGRSDRIDAALRRAQDWLRRDIASGQQLRDEILPKFLADVEDENLRARCFAAAEHYARESPDAPPFPHPVYWAPFIASGMAYPRPGKARTNDACI